MKGRQCLIFKLSYPFSYLSLSYLSLLSARVLLFLSFALGYFVASLLGLFVLLYFRFDCAYAVLLLCCAFLISLSYFILYNLSILSFTYPINLPFIKTETGQKQCDIDRRHPSDPSYPSILSILIHPSILHGKRFSRQRHRLDRERQASCLSPYYEL